MRRSGSISATGGDQYRGKYVSPTIEYYTISGNCNLSTWTVHLLNIQTYLVHSGKTEIFGIVGQCAKNLV